MEQFNHIYTGIVVQNDDPLQSGRVKVFIPSIHASLLELPEEQYNKNLNFTAFGKNVNAQNLGDIDLTEYENILKDKLPWCPVLMPITGETSNLKYNSSTGLSTPSDSPSIGASVASTDRDIGGGPGELYKGVTSKWSSSAAAGGIVANPNGGAFNTDKKYNTAKGNFAIPSVNAHVYVMFREGNSQYPVVVGSCPTSLDWQQNLSSANQPGTYENRTSNSPETSTDELIYRNMSMKSSGAYDVVDNNTLGNEFHSEIHKSGSSFTVTSDGSTHTLTTGDEDCINMGNSFVDTRGSSNVSVEGPETTVVRGDRIKRVGSLNVAAAQGEKQVLKNIDQYKALFETKRTNGGGVFNSLEQSKSGEGKPCPECSAGKKRPTFAKDKDTSNQFSDLLPVELSEIGFLGFSLPSNKFENQDLEEEEYPKTEDCKVCGGTGIAPSSMGGDFEKEDKKEKIGDMYVQSAEQLATYEEQLGEGGNDITEVTKNMVISVGCAFNDCDSVRCDPEGKFYDAGIEIDKKGPYNMEMASPLIEPKHVDDFSGGTFTLLANNKAAFMVGAGGLKFETAGTSDIYGTICNITGEQVNVSSSNEVNLGGGARLHLEGKILSLKAGSGQVLVESNLSVKNNLIVQGGAMVNGPLFCNGLVGPMSLQETEELQEAYATTNDKISKIIGYVIKEIIHNCEIEVNAGDMKAGGDPVTGKSTAKIKFTNDVPVKSKGDAGPEPNSVRVYPHSHIFRNINLTLEGNPEDAYEAAKSLTGDGPLPPPEIVHGKTGTDKDTNFNNENNYKANSDGGKETGKKAIYASFS